MEQQPQDEFSFQLLMNFLKQRRNAILLYGIVSLVLAVLLFGIGYTLLPSNKIFTQDIRIMLGEADVETVMQNMKNLPPTVSKSGQMIVIYPSGKPFVPADIINPVVLKQVYEKNKLQDMIDFDHFQNLFSITNYSEKLAQVRAEFREKLGRRNLTAVDLKRFEDDYNAALAKIDNKFNYVLSMRSAGIPPNLAAKILNEIPATWAAMYRKLEAAKIPLNNFDRDLAQKVKDSRAASYFIAIDQALYYNAQMLELCDQLKALAMNRAIALPDGEYLDDIIDSFRHIQDYQLNLLRQMLLRNPKLHSGLDVAYLTSRLQDIDQKLNEKRAILGNITDSIRMIGEKYTGNSAKTEMDKGTQVNFDSSFFSELSKLIRSDANRAMNQKLVNAALECGNEVALLEAQKQYYSQMLAALREKGEDAKTAQADSQAFVKLFDATIQNMISAARKTTEMKELLMKDYLSTLEFYAPVTMPALVVERLIPTRYMMAGVFGCWVFFNLLVILILYLQDAPKLKE